MTEHVQEPQPSLIGPFSQDTPTSSNDDGHIVSQCVQAQEPGFVDVPEAQATNASVKAPIIVTAGSKDLASDQSSRFRILFWWIPELVATVLSLVAFACTCIFLRICDGQVASAVHLPSPLTLNGLLALLSTINKACLMTPVASATMQEMWLYFAHEAGSQACQSQLQDVGLYANAASGALGSLRFILRIRRTRYVSTSDVQRDPR